MLITDDTQVISLITKKPLRHVQKKKRISFMFSSAEIALMTLVFACRLSCECVCVCLHTHVHSKTLPLLCDSAFN